MLTLHMLRHGDTLQSAEGTFCGELDPPLTESGKAQAEKAARFVATLGLDAIYVSPKLRARMTAAPIVDATKLDPRVREGLREIGYGSWEGRKEVEVRASEPAAFEAWVGDPGLVSPPGGESAFAIAARALPVMAEIRRDFPNGRVLVVSHKATVRVVTCALLGVALGRFRERIACPTASLTTFELAEHGGALTATLTRMGDTHYLAHYLA